MLFFGCHLYMFILFLQENLYQWLYFINILSYGCVYSVYAFDVVCDNKKILKLKKKQYFQAHYTQ